MSSGRWILIRSDCVFQAAYEGLDRDVGLRIAEQSHKDLRRVGSSNADCHSSTSDYLVVTAQRLGFRVLDFGF